MDTTSLFLVAVAIIDDVSVLLSLHVGFVTRWMSIGSRERAFKLPSSSKLVMIRHFGAIDVFMLLLASTVFDSLSFVVLDDDTAAVANFRVILTVTLSTFYLI